MGAWPELKQSWALVLPMVCWCMFAVRIEVQALCDQCKMQLHLPMFSTGASPGFLIGAGIVSLSIAF